jgi:hypothetical protein
MEGRFRLFSWVEGQESFLYATALSMHNCCSDAMHCSLASGQ